VSRYGVTLNNHYKKRGCSLNINQIVPMTKNAYLIARCSNQARAVAIAANMPVDASMQMQLGKAFQLLFNGYDIKWLLENFFLKKLFRAIA